VLQSPLVVALGQSAFEQLEARRRRRRDGGRTGRRLRDEPRAPDHHFVLGLIVVPKKDLEVV
jgi:hypothetical protein